MTEHSELAPSSVAATAAIIPMFSCVALEETLRYYRALGFEVTHEQTEPYQYGAVQWGRVEVHFHGVKKVDPDQASSCLIMVDSVEEPYRAFVERLRRAYGGLPISGFPRITRFREGHTRFCVYDPDGNNIVFIAKDEPEYDYESNTTESDESGFGRTLSGISPSQSALMQALEMAVFLRDTYHKDRGAAKKLDAALARAQDPDPIEYARVLAARAELAVALNETDRLRTVREELARIDLSDEQRAQFRDELQAADKLEEWLRAPD